MKQEHLPWGELCEFFEASLDRSEVRRLEPLGEKTTYRSGGACSVFIEVGIENDLQVISNRILGLDIPVAVLGNGSNLLVSDNGFSGLILRLGREFKSMSIEGETVIAGAAAILPVVARKTVAAGLTGFEWAVGVPGSMGGAVRMNAGGHGSDMSKSVRKVEGIDLETGDYFSLSIDQLRFSYRKSSISSSQVITKVDLGLKEGNTSESEMELSEIVRWRVENQPGGQNAGSVFTNPQNESAGRLIEAAGCKGLRIGTAYVSEKHANFIQVDHGGKSEDVAALIQEVRSRVLKKFGIELDSENHFLGFE
ncbi:MAG: UDP-N-acetylenolpyruvoylglucosamine reductase [Actinobacteria bacterium]|mgnify:CR=1 FL=1|nr:UDP-N-acetylenolpyruvoylglucosamine reductase [Actinomycetota bacterium]|tara:strand:+ start:7909 stop:8835 length:927 start_codon:yes stop_codon:yes gene_type:complete